MSWHLELRHLRYVVVLAEELHYGRAAQRLHIAQPALTQLVQRVEKELGAQLFDRSQRRVRLTEAGEILLPEARRILRDTARVTDAVRAAHRGDAGTVGIGFVGSAADSVLPDFLATYCGRHPRVAVRLEEGTTAQQIGWLHDERIAVGMGRTPIDDSAVSTTVLVEESLVLAVSDMHPLAREHSVALGELHREAFVMFPRHLGEGLYDKIHSACVTAGFTPHVVLEAVRMQTIVGLVSGGLGVALVPASVRNLGRAGVRYLTLDDDSPVSELSLMWRTDDPSPHVVALRKAASLALATTPSSPPV